MPRASPRFSLLAACSGLFLANALLRLGLAASLPLFYKEAYYWEWARFPSAGYLDHPPMVAGVIARTTSLLGERSELAVRAGALLFGTAAQLLVYRLAIQQHLRCGGGGRHRRRAARRLRERRRAGADRAALRR